MDRDDVISTLNNLIETCKDGENGFRSAAERVANGKIKALFLDFSNQRAQFARELQNEVSSLGGDAEESGSAAASLHRGWMDVKATVTGDDDGAIISECERGEDSAVSNYKDALEEDLPTGIRSLVQRQFAVVQEAHDQIRSLEQTRAARS
jgi:uncharacterized protein (TIGR02284 family)